MPKRTNDFQTLIKTIYEQIVPEGGSVTESGMVYDTDAKILREVDILVSYKYTGHEFNFIIECRDRSRSESIEWVDSLIGKMKSLKVNKVIAVSRKGFASSAERKAKENGIETLTLEAARDKDWTNFPIKPGLVVFTDDTYQIIDVQYKQDDKYVSVTSLGLESIVKVNDEVVGDLEGLTTYFFQEYLVPQINEYKKNNLLKLFKTREDLEKQMVVESEFDWPVGVYVMSSDGSKTELKKVKYLVKSSRKVMDVEQTHYIFNRKMVSTGKHLDSDGSILDFSIVQDTDTNKMHVRWRRKGIDENK